MSKEKEEGDVAKSLRGRQRNIGVAITNTKFAARLCLLHKFPNIGMANAIPAIPPAPSLVFIIDSKYFNYLDEIPR